MSGFSPHRAAQWKWSVLSHHQILHFHPFLRLKDVLYHWKKKYLLSMGLSPVSVATHQGSLLPILISLSQFYTMVILMLNLLIYSLTNKYVNGTTTKATGLKADSSWDTTFQDVSNSLIPSSNWQPTTALPAHTQLLSQEFHQTLLFHIVQWSLWPQSIWKHLSFEIAA